MASAFVGFAAGFFGPIFLSPDSAQGPLLGIFITGPVGAILGLAASLVYVLKPRKTSLGTNDT
jgi:hypothetical protein